MSDLARILTDLATPVRGEDWTQSVSTLAEGVRRAFTELGVLQPQLISVDVTIDLTPGTAVQLNHDLGVIPNRWSVVDIDEASTVFRTGTWTKQVVIFDASGGSSPTAVIKLWRDV